MARQRPILIGCPHYQKMVPGTYDCDEDGSYRLAPDGKFAVERAHCGHLGGRCAQTLCVLHRFSRQGERSWYPHHIMAAPDRKSPRKRRRPPSGSAKPTPPPAAGNNMDLLC